jgi:membrane protease YdiL (CAAX protease family)
MAPATSIGGVLARLLYGGITEEVLLRWGLMSVFAWLLWRVLQRGRNQPRPAIVWTANIAAAVLFGALHIPAAAAFLTLSAPLVVQIIVVNALAGVACGWLYWRRSLEAAMAAHAMVHVVFIAGALLGIIQG